MIVPDVTDFFFSKLIEGVESYLNPLGYVIMLCNSRHSQENEIKYLKELAHRSVDGILLATPNVLPDDYSLDSGFYKNMPIILIDRGLNTQRNNRLLPVRRTVQRVSSCTKGSWNPFQWKVCRTRGVDGPRWIRGV